jgi:hypothetical protein
MTSTSITVPRHTAWPRNVALTIAAVVLALLVTVAVMALASGQTTPRSLPVVHVGQSAPQTPDCLFRTSLHSAC